VYVHVVWVGMEKRETNRTDSSGLIERASLCVMITRIRNDPNMLFTSGVPL
jgi:hypothetical protein